MRITRKQLIRRWVENRNRRNLYLNEIGGNRTDYLQVRFDDCLQRLIIEYAPFVLYRRVPRQTDWCEGVLDAYDQDRFRSMVGLLRSTFLKLADRLRESERFRDRQQFPVDLQLAITLARLRSSEPLAKIAAIFGIGDGSSIQRITKRVLDAIMDLKLIAWPTPEEKMQMIADSAGTLPYCLGIIDGTMTPLKSKPTFNGRLFSTYKKNYAVKWQVICDMNKYVRHLKAVVYGSIHDSTLYKRSGPYLRSDYFFSGNEYIIGDSAYPVSPTCVTPYKTNSRAMTQQQRRMFNKILSKYRVRVEHCIGEIKKRFPSLDKMPIRIQTPEDVIYVSKWVTVAAMIHNFAKDNDDPVMYEMVDYEEVLPVLDEEPGEEISTDGEQKRQWLFDKMIVE